MWHASPGHPHTYCITVLQSSLKLTYQAIGVVHNPGLTTRFKGNQSDEPLTFLLIQQVDLVGAAKDIIFFIAHPQ